MMKFLKFSIKEEYFGIKINCIKEIVERDEITNIPNSSPEIEGIMDLRGNVTSIINPRIVLDMDDIDIDLDNYVIVLDSSEGLIVTEVHEVFELEKSDIDNIITEDSSPVLGITEHDNEFMTIIKSDFN